ncbi:MAG: hypothetical protein QM768_17870 [Agriterribacter sp.]
MEKKRVFLNANKEYYWYNGENILLSDVVVVWRTEESKRGSCNICLGLFFDRRLLCLQ